VISLQSCDLETPDNSKHSSLLNEVMTEAYIENMRASNACDVFCRSTLA
jgi:hypothetical protein